MTGCGTRALAGVNVNVEVETVPVRGLELRNVTVTPAVGVLVNPRVRALQHERVGQGGFRRQQAGGEHDKEQEPGNQAGQGHARRIGRDETPGKAALG